MPTWTGRDVDDSATMGSTVAANTDYPIRLKLAVKAAALGVGRFFVASRATPRRKTVTLYQGGT